MPTIDDLVLKVAIAVAVTCGAAVGRAFALEGENRRTSILAAAYCGAGAGLLSACLLAFVVVLIAAFFDSGAGIATDLGAIGSALLWGTAGGAGGGLVVGIVVATVKRYRPAPRV